MLVFGALATKPHRPLTPTAHPTCFARPHLPWRRAVPRVLRSCRRVGAGHESCAPRSKRRRCSSTSALPSSHPAAHRHFTATPPTPVTLGVMRRRSAGCLPRHLLHIQSPPSRSRRRHARCSTRTHVRPRRLPCAWSPPQTWSQRAAARSTDAAIASNSARRAPRRRTSPPPPLHLLHPSPPTCHCRTAVWCPLDSRSRTLQSLRPYHGKLLPLRRARCCSRRARWRRRSLSRSPTPPRPLPISKRPLTTHRWM